MVCPSQLPCFFVVDNRPRGATHLQHGISRGVIFDIDLHHGDFHWRHVLSSPAKYH